MLCVTYLKVPASPMEARTPNRELRAKPRELTHLFQVGGRAKTTSDASEHRREKYGTNTLSYVQFMRVNFWS